MPVIDVAMSSGFASLRRFNDLFRTRYRMTPGELAPRGAGATSRDRFAFDLAYRPPYDWDAMLDFLAQRAIAGVEAVEGRTLPAHRSASSARARRTPDTSASRLRSAARRCAWW